jgi:hypothetical protein
MALDTYNILRTTIADWLNRTDLTAAIPGFIELAEAKFNRDLRTRHQIKRSTATLTSQFITLPTDWVEGINVQLNTNPVKVLEYVTSDQADRISANSYGNTGAEVYTIIGTQLEIVPPVAVNTEIEMSYYAKIPALTTAAPTNWLLTQWPDLYLYGALANAAPYLREDERLATWKGMVGQLMEEVRMSDERARYSGGPLRARTRPIG